MYINKETLKRTPEPVKSSDRHRTPTIDPGRLFLSQTIHLCPEMHLFQSLGLGDTWWCLSWNMILISVDFRTFRMA